MQSITVTDEDIKRFVGAKVYNALGKSLGEVTDVTLSKTHRLSAIKCTDGIEYTRGQLMALDEIAIVKMPKQTTNKAKSVQKRLKPKQSEVNAFRIAMPPSAEKVYPVRRRYGDFNFLLGKTADKTITNFYNEIMIRKGATVTLDVLRQAKLSGKLIELCLHAK